MPSRLLSTTIVASLVGAGALAFVLGVPACTSETPVVTTPDGTPDGDDPSNECTLPKSQTVSEPCCEGWGVDACGANLFCASFEGRTQATCYPERSRGDGDECGHDRHCASGECNVERAACKAMPGASCTVEDGCAKSPTGDAFACAPFEGSLRCLPTSGRSGDPCATGADCASNECVKSRCTCAPSCDDRSCGDDGCGGSCGSCGATATCSAAGQCICENGTTLCGGTCTDTHGDDQNCGGCGKKCSGATGCSYSDAHKRAVCSSATYYPPGPGESITNCTPVCQRNGYPRCATTPTGGCSTYMAIGCFCERDPT